MDWNQKNNLYDFTGYYSLQWGGGVRRYILEFSRTGLIVYIVKTRAGGPTARLLAGYRAAGPLLGYFQERTLVLTQF